MSAATDAAVTRTRKRLSALPEIALATRIQNESDKDGGEILQEGCTAIMWVAHSRYHIRMFIR